MPRVINGVIDYFNIYNQKYLDGSNNFKPDLLNRVNEDKENIKSKLGDLLVKVKSNDEIMKFNDNLNDTKFWNSYLDEYELEYRKKPRFKEMNSIAVESYVYRSIHSIFTTSNKSDFYKYFDPYYQQKADSINSATEASNSIFSKVLNVQNRMQNDDFNMFDEFEHFLEYSLWANKSSDLCIAAGKEGHKNFGSIDDLKNRKSHILTDSTKDLFELFQELKTKPSLQIDFILDNGALEFISDLCFIEMLYRTQLIDPMKTTIRFFVKQYPWFISDVTTFDFFYTIEHLYFNVFAEEFHKKDMVLNWYRLLNAGKWKIKVHPFFTTPFEYYKMKRVSPDLYDDFASSDLLIFKGDLNYVKLLGNLLWTPTTPLSVALQNFKPTNLVSIRSAKYNLVVNLKDEQILNDLPEKWYSNGDYAMVTLYSKKN